MCQIVGWISFNTEILNRGEFVQYNSWSLESTTMNNLDFVKQVPSYLKCDLFAPIARNGELQKYFIPLYSVYGVTKYSSTQDLKLLSNNIKPR